MTHLHSFSGIQNGSCEGMPNNEPSGRKCRTIGGPDFVQYGSQLDTHKQSSQCVQITDWQVEKAPKNSTHLSQYCPACFLNLHTG